LAVHRDLRPKAIRKTSKRAWTVHARLQRKNWPDYWAEPVTGPGWAGWIQPSPYGWSRSSPVLKRKSGPDLGLRPFYLFSLYLVHVFYPPSILISGQTSLFLKSENSLNIWQSSRIYLWVLRVFFIFFLCVLFFFSDICSICGPLLLNTNLLCNIFFYSCLTRVNKKKGKQKEKGIEKLFLLH
jgi:hypothetical protein